MKSCEYRTRALLGRSAHKYEAGARYVGFAMTVGAGVPECGGVGCDVAGSAAAGMGMGDWELGVVWVWVVRGQMWGVCVLYS